MPGVRHQPEDRLQMARRYRAANREGLDDPIPSSAPTHREPALRRWPGCWIRATLAAMHGVDARSRGPWSTECQEVPALSTITEICAVMAVGSPGTAARPARMFGSGALNPTSCGRWISRVIFRWPAGAAIRSPCSTITPAIQLGLSLRQQTGWHGRDRLTLLFHRYGLPFAMLMDKRLAVGDRAGQPFTIFTVWLMRHPDQPGVAIIRRRREGSVSIAR